MLTIPTPALGRAALISLLAARAAAQGAAFQTPGMPSSPAPQGGSADSGQAGRFTSAFNPAFSFVIDGVADWMDREHGADGFDAELRSLELSANAWVDPKAWAYFVAATDGSTLSVEEAAVHYVGLGGNDTLRAGRFYVDFGKQMQTHVHELRTVERPLALRTLLGAEVRGDGVQWDSWTSVGDETLVRWSIGAFADLLPEPGDDFDPSLDAEASVDSRKDLQDLNFTARLTAFRDVGEHGVLQLGTSVRGIPSYSLAFAPSGDSADDLSNFVWGLDATYGWTGDTGEERWTWGGELLVDTGDTGARVVSNAIDVLHDTLTGYFVFGDYAWDRYRSAGLQFSSTELPGTGGSDSNEVGAYYTRMLSEYQRLRLSVSTLDSDVDGRSTRIALQYSAFLGAHGHGANW